MSRTQIVDRDKEERERRHSNQSSAHGRGPLVDSMGFGLPVSVEYFVVGVRRSSIVATAGGRRETDTLTGEALRSQRPSPQRVAPISKRATHSAPRLA